MRNPLRQPLSAPVRRMISVIVLSNLFVCALAALSLKSSYDLYHERATVTVRNTNLLLAQGVAAEIDRIDLGLKGVVDEYVRQRARGGVERRSFESYLVRLRERLPMVDGIRVTDERGDIIYADLPLPGPVWIGIGITSRSCATSLTVTWSSHRPSRAASMAIGY